MVAENLEFSTFQATITEGTDATDVPIATVGGALKEGGIQIKKRKRTDDGKIIYDILVVHTDVGSNALEYTKREITVTEGTDVTDQVLATVAGVTQAVDIAEIRHVDDKITYAIFAVHLNA